MFDELNEHNIEQALKEYHEAYRLKVYYVRIQQYNSASIARDKQRALAAKINEFYESVNAMLGIKFYEKLL